MRIRTIKPEFWQHETLAALPDFTRLMAVALLNYADDEGYFLASAPLIRGNLFPFEDDSTKILRTLEELSKVGWIKLGKDETGRQVGFVVNFRKHQKIDRANASKLKGSTTFDEVSTIVREPVAEDSLLEWNRDQGSGRGSEGIPPNPQGGKMAEIPPATPPPAKTEPAEPPTEAPKKKKKGGGAEGLEMPGHWPEAKQRALQEWVDYKLEQFGQRYKPMGFAKLVTRLEGYTAAELQAAVDLSMEKTWKGLVFPEQAQRQAGIGHALAGAATKKEGGGAGPVIENVCPAGFEAACEALYGRVPGPWATLGDGDQAEIRAWIQSSGEAGKSAHAPLGEGALGTKRPNQEGAEKKEGGAA